MDLSKRQKSFSQSFFVFLKSRSNFNYFDKKDDLHNLCISDIKDWEKFGYSNDLKVLFQKTLWQATW